MSASERVEESECATSECERTKENHGVKNYNRDYIFAVVYNVHTHVILEDLEELQMNAWWVAYVSSAERYTIQYAYIRVAQFPV